MNESIIKKFEELIGIEWRKLVTRWYDFGAADTEPDLKFQWSIKQILLETNKKLPESAEDWELFTTMPFSIDVAKFLTEHLNKVAKFIKENPDEYYVFLCHAQSALWRIDW